MVFLTSLVLEYQWLQFRCTRLEEISLQLFDQQLVDLIEYGFPLDFDRTRKLESTLQNHASARNYPTHVNKYLQEELLHNAILGPLDDKPFDVHISPLMTRDKSSSDCRRTIFDLSFL